MSLNIPKYHDLMNPTITALQALGGSASVAELNDRVIGDMKLSNKVIEARQGKGNLPVVWYRLARAKSYLKAFIVIDNSTRAAWSLTADYINVKNVDVNEVIRLPDRERQTSRRMTERLEHRLSR